MIKKIALEDIAEEITPGFACRPVGEGVGVLQMRPYSITEEGKFDFSQSKYVPCGFDDLEKYKMLKGDVLFNNTNSPVLVGKTALFNHDYDCVYSNHMTRIRIRKGLADPGYVARYLHSLFLNGIFKIRCQQWVNQAAISRTELGKLKIPLPSIDEQKSINDMLSQIESVLEKRRQTLALADEFLQSAFLEMFGDTGANSKGFKTKPIKDLVKKVFNEDPKRYPDKSYSYVDISSVDNQLKRIVKTTQILGSDAPSRARQLLQAQDILVSTVRPNLNAVGILPDSLGNPIGSTGFCVLRTDREFARPEYLFEICKTPFFIKSLVNVAKGASYPAVSDSDILRLSIPVPSLPEQQKFADLVHKVEKLKEKQKQSETQLQNLFNSLMQGAFKGEIFL